MNLPSIKTLAEVFGDRAREARAVLEADRETLAARPECAARIAQPLTMIELKSRSKHHEKSIHPMRLARNRCAPLPMGLCDLSRGGRVLVLRVCNRCPSLEGAKMKDTLAFVALSLAVVFFTVALFLELSK